MTWLLFYGLRFGGTRCQATVTQVWEAEEACSIDQCQWLDQKSAAKGEWKEDDHGTK